MAIGSGTRRSAPSGDNREPKHVRTTTGARGRGETPGESLNTTATSARDHALQDGTQTAAVAAGPDGSPLVNGLDVDSGGVRDPACDLADVRTGSMANIDIAACSNMKCDVLPGTTVPNGNSVGDDNEGDDPVAIADRPVVTVRTKDYFEQSLCDRLNKINAYVNPNTGTYTLRTLPFEATHWGPIGYGRADKSEYLCVGGERIMLFAVGEIVFPNFLKKGTSVRKPGVLFRPLLEDDYLVASRLLRAKASPNKNYSVDPEGFWASRWMGNPSMSDDQIPPFSRVYDALDTYRPKVNMGHYDAAHLKIGDIVLVEMYVVRWAVKDAEGDPGNIEAKKKVFKKRREWRSWNVEFRLDALSLLYLGSDFAQEDERADEVFEV